MLEHGRVIHEWVDEGGMKMRAEQVDNALLLLTPLKFGKWVEVNCVTRKDVEELAVAFALIDAVAI